MVVVVMVFNATFNNISVISLRLVLLVDESVMNPEKTTDLPQVSINGVCILLAYLYCLHLKS